MIRYILFAMNVSLQSIHLTAVNALSLIIFFFCIHKKNDSYEQLQVFIEPKGAHLIDKDRWKEDFLLQIESKAIPVTKFADDNKYKIWGFHFFNRDERSVEFDNDMIKL